MRWPDVPGGTAGSGLPAGADYAGLVGLEKTLAFNISGHVLHSLWNLVNWPDVAERFSRAQHASLG